MLKNNILHFFVYCNLVNKFWKDMSIWLCNTERKPVILDQSKIIFSVLNGVTSFCLNFCILHAKWFIHFNKVSGKVNFDHFLCYLRNVIYVEKEIAISNCNIKYFEMKFKNVLNLLVKNL